MRKLKDHYKVRTDDGTETLFSTLYNESCHSQTGASLETKLHYIEGCLLPIKFQTAKEVSILEVGLGTGLGYIETLKAHKELSSEAKIIFTSLEISPELLEFTKTINEIGDEYPHFKELKLTDENCGLYQAQKNGHTLEVILGDARTQLPKYLEKYQTKYDCFYQDAFSPKRNATLWTYEWFLLLKELATPFAALATYSASSAMRKAMIQAGWRLTKGASFGPKRSSTRASLIGETDPDIALHLERSPAIVLSDENAKDYKL